MDKPPTNLQPPVHRLFIPSGREEARSKQKTEGANSRQKLGLRSRLQQEESRKMLLRYQDPVKLKTRRVMHPFEGEDIGELSLSIGDYVVVRQMLDSTFKSCEWQATILVLGFDCLSIMHVSPTGWSEGECKGKAGWFPSSYVEERQRIPASKVEAKRAYHQRAAEILDQLQVQMVADRQRSESIAPLAGDTYMPPPSYEDAKVDDASQQASGDNGSKALKSKLYFLVELKELSTKRQAIDESINGSCRTTFFLGGRTIGAGLISKLLA